MYGKVVVWALLLNLVIMLMVRGSEKPNILWLTCEDSNVSWIGCYGNPHADTPHIDKMALDGFRYTHCFANAPVCAPSRSTWITGMHAASLGTLPMRSRNVIPHGRIKYYPDYLRSHGYYCSNVKKTDYNIGGRPDGDCWDSKVLQWKTLRESQPFFQVINFGQSHESRAQGELEKLDHDPAKVRLALYHPETEVIRKNYAKYHSAVHEMDAMVGRALRSLEEHGLKENTIVVFNSDHGGVMPRSKRFLYDSGIHCPLIIMIPEKYKDLWPAEKTGMVVDQLVSFVDMPATWLSIAGIEPPARFQGRVFLGESDRAERDYHFSYRGRMDERIDNVRAVRTKRFLYIRNYMPHVPRGQHLEYLWKMWATVAWHDQFKNGKTDSVTGRWF
ncbi:sulfatase [Rubritalea tangerina]|uniref:Sulfatase n=2 Tax=Rubritalea tangerina TaxID=430798 RepID=A0ABW4Z7P5_9BACT